MDPPADAGAAARPVRIVAIDAGALSLLLGLLAWLVARLIDHGITVTDLPLLAAAAVLGVLATDLTSGVVHWFCDTFLEEDTPIAGPLLIAPFREHHRDPLAMTRHGFLEVNRANVAAMAIVLALVAWHRGGAAGSLFADAWLLSYALAVVCTNQFHKWAHLAAPPRLARWMQSARLAVRPEHHARHHDPAGGRTFCVTTGWLNPVLDGLGILAAIERLASPRRP